MRKFNVKREVTFRKAYRKWEDYETGDIVIGEYVGTHKDQYGKECPVIKVEEAFFKDSKTAQMVIGQNLVINSSGIISKAFEKIAIGEIVQIEYQGTSKIEKGPYKGKDAHMMKVDVVEISTEDADL